MKNCWLERKKIRDRYDKYTVFLFTMTSAGPDYFGGQKLTPEVHWEIFKNVTVHGFAFFQGKKFIWIHQLDYPVHAKVGNQIIGKFDIRTLPLP